MSDCSYKHTERAGLYIMVFIIMVTVCGIKQDVSSLESKVGEIHTATVEREWVELELKWWSPNTWELGYWKVKP